MTPAKRRRARPPTSPKQPTMPLWPAVGELFGLGRSATFDAARRGEFPFPVWRIGRRLVCPTARVHQALGLDGPDNDGDGAGAMTPSPHPEASSTTTRRAARKAVGADGEV
jgi:predicted DNA-binding transcriptional regulator AlpA